MLAGVVFRICWHDFSYSLVRYFRLLDAIDISFLPGYTLSLSQAVSHWRFHLDVRLLLRHARRLLHIVVSTLEDRMK